MALQYIKQLAEDKWLLSENNNIIQFTDDDNSRRILYAEFIIGSELPNRVYADPKNVIWYNVRENVAPRLNDYDDTLDFSTIVPTNLDTFFMTWDKVYLNYQIDIRVVFDNDDVLTDSRLVNFVLGVEQVIEFFQGMTIKDKDMTVLSPLKDGTSNTYYLKYWEGYPFDIAFTRRLSDSGNISTIQNLSTGQSLPTFTTNNIISRIVLTNGTTSIAIEDYLPLPFGLNTLMLDSQNIIELHKVPTTCGKYIKWLNQYGSYSYWLFENYSKSVSTRATGVINNDFFNIEDTVSQTKSLGRTATEDLVLFYEELNEHDIKILSQVVKSPKIYLYVGERFTPSSIQNWVEVNIGNKNIVTRDFKNKVPNGTITIELPELKTIRL